MQVLLLLSSTTKSLMHLLCPDVTNVLKTIMTYVAVRLLVYEVMFKILKSILYKVSLFLYFVVRPQPKYVFSSHAHVFCVCN